MNQCYSPKELNAIARNSVAYCRKQWYDTGHVDAKLKLIRWSLRVGEFAVLLVDYTVTEHGQTWTHQYSTVL